MKPHSGIGPILALAVLASSCSSREVSSIPSSGSPVLPSPTGPVITQITPTAGAPGTVATVRGSGFAAEDNVVQFGSTSVRGIGSEGGIALRFIVPADPQIPPGNYAVAVTAKGQTSNSALFRVEQSTARSAAGGPALDRLAPSAGAVGTIVTIFGTGFAATGNTVKMGAGFIRNLASPDGTTLAWVVPDGLDLCPPDHNGPCPAAYPPAAPGNYTIFVVSQGQTSNSATFTLTKGQ